MANHTNAIKAHKKSLVRNARNRMHKSKMATFIISTINLIHSGDCIAAQRAFNVAQSTIMKGVNKGVIKFNTAIRRVKRLSRCMHAKFGVKSHI